ncbi:MAG: hypothetical protein JST16_15925, partial [Bdellovibrionales bacterium]|nr:hypothetical protein [Bdellovibrionales bacterium]
NDEQTLSFFEVHRQADVYHTQAISELLEQLSPEEKVLASAAARDAACALWSFLDGIHGECPERATTSPAQA